MRYWTAKAYAKINLSLDVLSRQADGYHRLEMVMQSIDLADTITLETKDSNAHEISLFVYGQHTPRQAQEPSLCLPLPSNLAWKAAEAFLKLCPGAGVSISLTKRIPIAAGLAGGSADAAAVLKGLNEMRGHPLSKEKLYALGKSLGADIPFCLHGGTCLAEGTGEILTPLRPFSGHWLLLVKPGFAVSTRWVFNRLRLSEITDRPNTKQLAGCIENADFAGAAKAMGNVLEQVTEKAYPEITQIRERLVALGALGSRMSGSGPSVFGLFRNEEEARIAYEAVSKSWSEAFICQTL